MEYSIHPDHLLLLFHYNEIDIVSWYGYFQKMNKYFPFSYGKTKRKYEKMKIKRKTQTLYISLFNICAKCLDLLNHILSNKMGRKNRRGNFHWKTYAHNVLESAMVERGEWSFDGEISEELQHLSLPSMQWSCRGVSAAWICMMK